ncbi:hypothetical protein INS49_002854 [Diaporthe citri]|uniref:uncharacterized protein n=1 Tax=Diaporthe citri TaxID=83186 RepID=UPI001C817605|nr:uncharacterized protein INS49_002854 [Diaporthe citri]KAG6368641.1 hypothetical protein INS49_002854 [Diaporthe citri]
MATNISEVIAQLPLHLQEQFLRYEETLRPNMYAASGVSLLLVYVCVSLRIYGRRLQGQSLWWDDYMSVAALLFTSASAAVLTYLTYLGFGRHEIVLILEHSEEIRTFLRMAVASHALYIPPIFFSKLSILFQYRRLFPAKRFKSVLIAVGVATAVYCIISMILLTALCLPVHVPTLEDPLAPPLTCVNLEYMLIWICSWNAALDLIILLLPMHYVWRLNTTFRRKLQLTFVFLFGSFVVAISILRTWYFMEFDFSDATWTGSPGNMWTEVEACMAIVVGCLPAMMPIFRGSCFGRQKPGDKPIANINLVTFGSSGKKNKLRDLSATMTTTVNATRTGDGNYTDLTDHVSHEDRTRQYSSGGKW